MIPILLLRWQQQHDHHHQHDGTISRAENPRAKLLGHIQHGIFFASGCKLLLCGCLSHCARFWTTTSPPKKDTAALYHVRKEEMITTTFHPETNKCVSVFSTIRDFTRRGDDWKKVVLLGGELEVLDDGDFNRGGHDT